MRSVESRSAIFATEWVLMTYTTRVAFRQMMGVFSQYDKSQIVLKLRGARQRKRAQTGRREGRKPYGDREGEQRVIEQMRRLRRDGFGLHVIAASLNEEGIPPRSGKQWYAATVRKILARPVKSGTR